MRLLSLVVLSTALTAFADIGRENHGVARHHHRAPQTPAEPAPQLRKRRSCKAPSTTSTKKHTTTTKKTSSTAKPKATPQSDVTIPGTIKVNVARCGKSGATKSVTKTTGPNGSIDWLNCGLNDGGWNPPDFTIDQAISMDLQDSLSQSSSPFHACSKYTSLFYKHGDKNGLPPILLAAFAMQESSCDPSTVGGGGEQGLMQISKDKCGGAPDGNCKDPDFNIGKGAQYFAQTLKNNNDNLLLSIGEYNGWFKGLTYGKATAARHSSCCLCQNNLDYLFQFMNGWLLGKNAYSMGLGKYFNLEVCGNDD